MSACLPLSGRGLFIYSVCLWALLNIQCKKDFLRKVSWYCDADILWVPWHFHRAVLSPDKVNQISTLHILTDKHDSCCVDEYLCLHWQAVTWENCIYWWALVSLFQTRYSISISFLALNTYYIRSLSSLKGAEVTCRNLGLQNIPCTVRNEKSFVFSDKNRASQLWNSIECSEG